MSIRTEAGRKARAGIAAALSTLLADSYTLYLKTQNYHWNVEGPQFHALHNMFEEQYVELREAVDRIAERIRALGFLAPGSFASFAELTSIGEATDGITPAGDMVRTLAEGHETLAETARTAVEEAEKAVDVATADLATNRVEIHEKTAWMLRAMSA
ncbi:MAG: DNA starvation/stationary phase protection protein [Acidimicrobiia bacterium]